MEKRSAICSSEPSIPSPSSSTKKPLPSKRPTEHFDAASSALSVSSFATSAARLFKETPAFWHRVSRFLNNVQSSREHNIENSFLLYCRVSLLTRLSIPSSDRSSRHIEVTHRF